MPASGGGVFCRLTITSTSGERAGSRSGRSTSTSRWKGTSSWAVASSTVSRTAPRNRVNGTDSSTVERSTRVLTKNPARFSSSVRVRPEVAVPTATSVVPQWRASRIWVAATSTVNRVAPRSAHSARSRATTGSGTAKVWAAPAGSRTGGRGRSVGSSSGDSPVSWPRQ